MTNGFLLRVGRNRITRAGVAPIATIATWCAFASPATAHGFGQRYDLPLPLSLYLFATAAAVVLSFVVVALFMRHTPGAGGYPRFDVTASPFSRWFAHPLLAIAPKLLAVGMLALTIAAGFFGDQDPYRNIAPTLVWIIWWVGLAILSAFIGDLWAVANPWKSLFDWAEQTWRLLTRRSGLSVRLPYPETLGVWPAVGLLLAVSWTELIFPSPAVPTNIAGLAVSYTLLTWAGMVLFGGEVWLRRGEVFAVFFGLFARFAPTEQTRNGWALRPPAAGLLENAPASPSQVAFVLLVLASVLYDGLLTTPEWTAVETPLLALMPGAGQSGPILVRTIGLLSFWTIFLAAFLAVGQAMRVAAGGGSAAELAQVFALTLVPIAIAYHLAHYLTYLLTQGQYLIPLLSDPFGWGWNLFGTAGYRGDIAIVGARFAWWEAVAAIVAGHIIAVYLADVRAHQIFSDRGAALRSQLPLTALMVVYTFVSLSILAEPIVQRRAPATPSASLPEQIAIPEQALLPEPGTGELKPVGPGRSARVRLHYRVLGSAFHDGTRTSEADLLYAYMFAYRWSSVVNGSGWYDPAVAAVTLALRQRLRGVLVAGVDTAAKSFRVGDVNFVRELFLVDVYADTPREDADQMAAFTPPWSTLPWHLLMLMEEAVGRGWAAFSRDEAARRGVEWLDLVRSESLKTRLAGLVDDFAGRGYRAPALAGLVDEAEAKNRWAALALFYRQHGHFLVTNGPYRLKSWSDGAVTLDVFRDLSYPLGVGSYDTDAVPRRGYVSKVERTERGLRLSADIETVQKFMRDYQIVRQKLPAIDATVRNRAAPQCRYAVIDATGQVALAGTMPPQDDLTFAIELDGRLPPGQYTVLAEVLVNGNAMVPQIERIPVVIGASR